MPLREREVEREERLTPRSEENWRFLLKDCLEGDLDITLLLETLSKRFPDADRIHSPGLDERGEVGPA